MLRRIELLGMTLRRMSATHIGAHRTRHWREHWRCARTHLGAYFIGFFTTHFQAATTIDLRDRRFSLHPTVVQNALWWNKGPTGDAAGGNSTWLCNKMRVIGAAGMSGRHLRPLVNIGGGGGEQVMLVAVREKVHFHAMPDPINPCLAPEIGQSQFRIGRDKENGAILEGQRVTEMYLSSTRPFERLLFFLEYPCHGDHLCLSLRSKNA